MILWAAMHLCLVVAKRYKRRGGKGQIQTERKRRQTKQLLGENSCDFTARCDRFCCLSAPGS